MSTEMTIEKKRGTLSSMLKVDFRRMFTQRFLYVMVGICFLIPILILVMTTAVGGGENAGTADMFTNTWQVIGTVSGGSSGMVMDMTTMCNINLLYFGSAVFVAVFVSGDFKSGYVKNLFAGRPGKRDYVISKTLACFVGCAGMLLAFFAGTLLGGAIAGLPFAVDGVTAGNIAFCLLSKIFLMAVFVGIDLAVSAFAKEKTWLGIVGGFLIGMLLFMMIPAMTPLDATVMNAGMCLIGGVLFSVGLGAVSTMILSKRDLL